MSVTRNLAFGLEERGVARDEVRWRGVVSPRRFSLKAILAKPPFV